MAEKDRHGRWQLMSVDINTFGKDDFQANGIIIFAKKLNKL
jgi:lysyl-tRNA synthetase class I